MSHKDDKHLTPKEKLLKKNLKDRLLFLHADRLNENVDIGTPEVQKPAQHTPESGQQPVWSARVQEIRDRNTGRKRAAQDRWNRMAGTSSSGGRGR